MAAGHTHHGQLHILHPCRRWVGAMHERAEKCCCARYAVPVRAVLLAARQRCGWVAGSRVRRCGEGSTVVSVHAPLWAV
jgi:hypothetical protein